MRSDQDQVNKTKEFLSSNFSMKDMEEAVVILGIRIKREDKEGYSDASWITNSEDHTSTTGWVSLLGGCAISWASKKQTCITDSTMEAEFVALAAVGKEAEWLRNLIYEISLWPKLISPIFIHCDTNYKWSDFLDFVRSRQNLADHLTKGLARDLVHKSTIRMGLKSIEISNDESPNSLLVNVGVEFNVESSFLVIGAHSTQSSQCERIKELPILLIALAATYNLVIHQMDVKTAFLNGDLKAEQAAKQWHQEIDEVVLSSGFVLNQFDKTDQDQVDKTKEFLSSNFSMKDMGEADVILGIRIKREDKCMTITQSHYIEKILKNFQKFGGLPVSF
ncbi:zinc finger, CCHC-type containing protein [Tanacetum coccineum]